MVCKEMCSNVVDPRLHDVSRRLDDHCFASLFSSRDWMDAVARTYDIDFQASVPANGIANSAILFTHIRDMLGERIVCLPFSDYCDPLVDNIDAWEELVAPLLHRGVPVKLRCLRNSLPKGDSRFALRRKAKWHGVDLTRSNEAMWAGLSPQARQNVRRALKSGVNVREGKCLSDVQIFYRMHAHIRKVKYRLLPQPFRFFENLHATFTLDDRLTVLIAELHHVPLAAIFLLQWKNVLYYKFNASIDQRCRPNDLLAWHAMLLGQQRGLVRLDFGLSDSEQEGLVRYKRKFATEERDIFFWEHSPQFSRDTRGEDARAILGSITEWATDPEVPDRITGMAGDRLYRLFA
jgi:hypothetical protein